MISKDKLETVCRAMREAGLDMAVFLDREGARNPNLAYLTGHPFDAVALITASGERFLFPWDLTLARKKARDVAIVDPDRTRKGYLGSVVETIRDLAGDKRRSLAFPASTPYVTVRQYEKALPSLRIVCETGGIDRILAEARAVKSGEELRILSEGFAIADEVIALLPAWLEENKNGTTRELDLALFLQKEMLDRGTDGAREALLVANADRSALVHPHPQAGTAPLFKPGLALTDFWMRYEEYYTDITVPILVEPLTKAQEQIVETVLGVYDDTMKALIPGASVGEIASRAQDVFAANGLRPVGGLGHGLGLTGHDAPALRAKPKDDQALATFRDTALAPGMVLAVEPGVVHEEHGGFRLENDVIIGPEKAEIKTHAKPLRVKGA